MQFDFQVFQARIQPFCRLQGTGHAHFEITLDELLGNRIDNLRRQLRIREFKAEPTS